MRQFYFTTSIFQNTYFRFNDDDDSDDYQPSDSDEEYTSKEKEMIRKATNKTKDFSDSEVFGISVIVYIS